MEKIVFKNNQEPALNETNLNELQENMEKAGVVVSATEPTTNEKVWFQTGKNLFNIKNYFIDVSGHVGFNLNLELGKTYTISSNKPLIAKFAENSSDSGGNVGPQNWDNFTSWTFTAGENTNNHLNNHVFLGKDDNIFTSYDSLNGYNIQIEQGTVATDYEEYITRKIYTKSLNNVYDLFYDTNKNEIREGTWTPYVTNLGTEGTSVEYLIRRANYKRIGKMVYVEIYVRGRITALNGSTKYGIIGGLPFSMSTNNSYFGQTAWPGMTYNLLESNDPILLMPVPGEKTIRIEISRGTVAAEMKTTTETSGINYFEIGGNGWYITDEA